MDTNWVEAYCAGKKGAVRVYQEEWECWLYRVGDKMFLMDGGDKEEKPILTVKLEPGWGQVLRQEYPDVVVPGYYMNKQHWNSVYTAGEFPEKLMKEMIDQSYALILGSLPKKRQREITGE